MGLNKTLYIKDEDASVWEESREYFRDTLTSFLTQQLKVGMLAKRAEAQGFERIILSFREEGIPRTKAFYGRWLISPDHPFTEENYDFDEHHKQVKVTVRNAVAVTARNRIVVFMFGEQKEDGTFTWGSLDVFDSFEEANSCPHIPSDLIATAMEIMGVPVEELDI